MDLKNLESIIQNLQVKKNELEEQADKMRSQLNALMETINSIKKNFDDLAVNTNVTTQMYDLLLRECENELSYKNHISASEKKKPFVFKEIAEKLLEKERRLPKNASITQLAAQLTPSRKGQ